MSGCSRARSSTDGDQARNYRTWQHGKSKGDYRQALRPISDAQQQAFGSPAWETYQIEKRPP